MRSFLLRAVLVLPLAGGAWACGSNPLPTTPTEPTLATEVFSGTVTVNGAVTHNFYSTSTGSVTATLTALSPESTPTIGLGLGTWNGASCAVIIANDRAVLSSIVTGTVSTIGGSLCIRIYDVGAMTEPTDYTVTVVHP